MRTESILGYLLEFEFSRGLNSFTIFSEFQAILTLKFEFSRSLKKKVKIILCLGV